MAITDVFVLPKDLYLVAISDLAPEVREKIQCDVDDVALTRPRSRTPSKVVDAQAALLLKEFRSPSTIVEAVIRYCTEAQLDPDEILTGAYPMLDKLVKQRLLVPPESPEANEIHACYETGDKIGRFTVRSMVQVLEDTELYQGRDENGEPVALKVVRPHGSRDVNGVFAREGALLRHLDGTVTPHLLEEGVWEDRAYIAMEWCAGIPADKRAAELRTSHDFQSRCTLHALCGCILRAYAHLHAQNVIHSDIHPRNLLVTDEGQVRLVDFGYARLDDAASPFSSVPRAGVGFFYEPELVRAQLTRHHTLLSSQAGEQYAVAALLYHLLTGVYYLDFSMEKKVMQQQILELAPLPFEDRGAAAWPEIETLLRRALSKEPEQRFVSLADFAAQWEAVALVAAPQVPAPIQQEDISAALQLLERMLQQTCIDGPLLSEGLPKAPICSVNSGAAGIAYALYRIACIRESPELLALADVWNRRALRDMQDVRAFHNAEVELTPEVVGNVSLFHTPSGIHCVEALLAHARGDAMVQQSAFEAFVRIADQPCDNIDLTLGRAGLLLGCAFLVDTRPTLEVVNCDLLRQLGDRIMRSIWEVIDTYGPIAESPELTYLGIAHGWAGLLYATLLWCRSAALPLPQEFGTRMEQLAELAEPMGRGVRWRHRTRGNSRVRGIDYVSGWCNGSAGHSQLWTLAYRHFNNPTYLTLAVKAAWHAYDTEDRVGDLCCGNSGRAYAMLNLYRHTGDRGWIQRARRLANLSAIHVREFSLIPESLYKGEAGIAVLAADLAQPEEAYMPLFEPANWPNA